MDNNRKTLRQRWTIESAWGQEKRIAQEVRELAAKLAFPPDRADDMASAVAEACLNAMEHGNEGRPDRLVTVDLQAEAHTVRIRVYDGGPGFAMEQTAADRRDIMLDSPRGWGIPLIRGLTDEWGVGRTAEGFYIELTFRQTGKAGELCDGTV